MYCASCGAQIAEGSRYCGHCGAQEPVQPAPVTAAPAPVPVPACQRRSAGNTLTWPFHQDQRPTSLWIAALASIPLISVISQGWWLDAAGRRGRAEARLLPENRDLLHMLRDGLIAAVMVIVYFVIPLLIIAIVFDWGWDQALARFVDWGDKWIGYWWVTLWGGHGVRPQDFWQLLKEEFERWLLHKVAPILYLVAAIPMFVTAMARFALTRRAASFFHLLSNAELSIRYLGSMAKFLFLVLLWSLAGVVALSAAMATAIGVAILPVVYFLISAAEVWISARLAGNLAARIWESHALAKHRPQAPGRAAAAAG